MKERNIMKGFKVFNSDWTCRGFQYKVGETYRLNGKLEICENGFHFCQKASDCFRYYDFNPRNHVAEVEATGNIEESKSGTKVCTDEIKIIREIPWEEVLRIVNTGDCNTGNRNTGDCNTGNRNTGDCNTGDCNTGNWNTGNWNTGDCNTGNRNTGNWNTGNWNTGDCNTGNRNTGNWNTGNWNTGDWNLTSFSSGCFNTKEQKILMFDKPSGITYREWVLSDARALLSKIPRKIVEWVDSSRMTDTEKVLHPEHKTIGGYLKVLDVSENAQTWWNGLEEDAQNTIKSLPNFDAEIFEKCTGIKVDM
jgi:hypothetical protein